MWPRPPHFVTRAVHGGLDHAELQRLGIDPEEVLDFSSNTNPYGPSPAVRAALANVPLDRYPDREALALRAALADFIGVSAERILVGNGASELIVLAALTFAPFPSKVLIVGPTYGEYQRAAGLVRNAASYWRPRAEDNFVPNPDAIGRLLVEWEPRLVFLCSPNNPTGVLFPSDALAWLSRRHPETTFVVDEAYQPFASQHGSALDLRADNVLVLRSLTKDFGLAGVRLGCAVGPQPLIAELRCLQTPWSVGTLAQAAGIAALGDLDHRTGTLALLNEAKATLIEGLKRIGLPLMPSAVPFFLVRVGEGGAAFRESLLRRRILVRDCASFGLPDYVRISTRRPEENERLLVAIREVR